jgi:hypothetical protein
MKHPTETQPLSTSRTSLFVSVVRGILLTPTVPMAELKGVAAKAPKFPISGFFFRASTKTGGALQEPRVLALHYDEAS